MVNWCLVVQRYFFTFSAREVSDSDNVDDDGDDVDIQNIFDDPALEEQLRQNDVQCEWELQEQGATFTVTADVHLSSKTQHVDVVSTSL